jgi:hypothetical protein
MCLIMSVQHQTNITEENKGSRVCLIYLTTLYDSYNCKYDTFCHKDNIYMTFQSSDFERTRWRLLQEHLMHIKLDIYVLLNTNLFLNAKAFWPFVEPGLSTTWSCKKYLLTIAVRNSWKRYSPICIGLKKDLNGRAKIVYDLHLMFSKYEKKILTVMYIYSTNINKRNNHLSI